jgi:hypothetical protein
MDTPSEEKKPSGRRKIKTRIRRPEDPVAHLLHKRERRLERVRKIRWWIVVLSVMGLVFYACIYLWELFQ